MTVSFLVKQVGKRDKSGAESQDVKVDVAELESTTVADLKRSFFKAIGNTKGDVNRYRFTLSTGSVLAPNEKALSTFAIPNTGSMHVECKDLGPQISWKGVFVVEYLFPMLVFPLIWSLQKYAPKSVITKSLYATGHSASPTTQQWQNLLALLFTLHFLKRELETIFVHRFGNDTMPLRNIFKNSGYYWMFAAWIAYVTLHPQYTVPACHKQRLFGVALFIISELLNFKAHMDLRNLRPEGTRIRRVPRGILFKFISCPNYLFEILAWVGFTLASQSVASAVFAVVGAAQMTAWAIAKHKRYRKEFDGKDGREQYPRGRKILLPFIF